MATITSWKDGLRAFLNHHVENLGVWRLFQKYAIELHGSAREHAGAQLVAERCRWEASITTTGEFKINNNLIPFYARMFNAVYCGAGSAKPNFFRTRSLDYQGSDAKMTERWLGRAFSTLR